jgi:elongator complex protein 3
MYGADMKDDLESFRMIVEDDRFKPDMLKIYPTLVVKGTALYNLWRMGRYRPPDTEEAVRTISEFLKICPPWIRVQRMQRDIPVSFIEAGVKRSDIRNLIDDHLTREGLRTWEIRSREIGMNEGGVGIPHLVRRDYTASGGKEVFLSMEDGFRIFGFLRLRLPSDSSFRPEMFNSSVVREIKVLGEVVPLGEHRKELWQHRGMGKDLLRVAEEISSDEFGCSNINVISGIGVREYFRKNGYERNGPYMGKPLR